METLINNPSSELMISKKRLLLMHEEGKRGWTKEENETFENALAMFEEDSPDRWFKVAAMIPNKSVYDVINHYRQLVADVTDIEAGFVPVPPYLLSPSTFPSLEQLHTAGFDLRPSPSHRYQRKKGVPWTEAEHRRFLLGLEKYGKGDWKNISRNFVVSKTPTQVASHAQKYYMRRQMISFSAKDKRRPSIHDTTIHLTPSLTNNEHNRLLLDSGFRLAYPYADSPYNPSDNNSNNNL